MRAKPSKCHEGKCPVKNTTTYLLLSLLAVLAACSPAKRETDLIEEAVRADRKLVRICVDAGHGGQDFGTHSIGEPVYHEKNLALSTSLMLRNHLQKKGYQVVLTRKNDTFIPLLKRTENALNNKADLFVSVHYNSAPRRAAHGVEVFYYDPKRDSDRAVQSKKLASNVLEGIINSTHQNSRGVKHGNFAVVRETKMPAILVEAGFVTNEAEMQRIRNPRYQNRIAWGIAEGIDEFLFGHRLERLASK